MRRMSPVTLRVGRPALLSGFRHARLEPGIHAVVCANDCGSGVDPRVGPGDDEVWRWAGAGSARRSAVSPAGAEGEQEGEAQHGCGDGVECQRDGA